MKKNVLCDTQELDLNLYHLLYSLYDLEGYKYDKDIKEKLTKFILYIDKKLYKYKYHYDILDTKCILKTYYEKEN